MTKFLNSEKLFMKINTLIKNEEEYKPNRN